MKKLLHPYVFVPFPQSLSRAKWASAGPCGHERNTEGGFTGHLKCTLTTATKLCLKSNFQSLAGHDQAPYIPGSSLKGMVRNMLQILGEGCAGQQFKDKRTDEVAERNGFQLDLSGVEPCKEDSACLACRLFGYSLEKDKTRKWDGEPFGWAGKVRFFDSEPLSGWSNTDWVALNQGAFDVAEWPKARPTDHGPRHLPFYFPNSDGRPAGWKLYRHANNIREVDEERFGSRYCVRGGSVFHFTVAFENLSPQEYAVFTFALTLQHHCPAHTGESSLDLVHKLGYGKGVGLGACLVRIESVEFELPGRWFGLRAPAQPNLPACGLESLHGPSLEIVRQARGKRDAAYLLLYPQKPWFNNPKGTIASFDASLTGKPPKLIEPQPLVPPPASVESPDKLPPQVKMKVTSIKAGKIRAESVDLYNGKNYRCEVNEERWTKLVKPGEEITVEVKQHSTDHKRGTFEGSSWTQ